MSVQIIDKGWKKLQKELKLIDGSVVKVGFSEEKDETHDNAEISIAHLAAIHEYGDQERNIPARPFMTQAFDKNRSKINQFIAKEQVKIYDGKQTTEQALERIGNFFKGIVQETIDKGEFEPNSAKTLARKAAKASGKGKKTRKGAGGPLIDSGQMIQSVDFEVELK